MTAPRAAKKFSRTFMIAIAPPAGKIMVGIKGFTESPCLIELGDIDARTIGLRLLHLFHTR